MGNVNCSTKAKTLDEYWFEEDEGYHSTKLLGSGQILKSIRWKGNTFHQRLRITDKKAKCKKYYFIPNIVALVSSFLFLLGEERVNKLGFSLRCPKFAFIMFQKSFRQKNL